MDRRTGAWASQQQRQRRALPPVGAHTCLKPARRTSGVGSGSQTSAERSANGGASPEAHVQGRACYRLRLLPLPPAAPVLRFLPVRHVIQGVGNSRPRLGLRQAREHKEEQAEQGSATSSLAQAPHAHSRRLGSHASAGHASSGRGGASRVNVFRRGALTIVSGPARPRPVPTHSASPCVVNTSSAAKCAMSRQAARLHPAPSALPRWCPSWPLGWPAPGRRSASPAPAARRPGRAAPGATP